MDKLAEIIGGNNYQPESSSVNMDNYILLGVIACLIFGVVAAAVANHNKRSVALGFLTGFFFGPLGIMTHMIMGEKEHFSSKRH